MGKAGENLCICNLMKRGGFEGDADSENGYW